MNSLKSGQITKALSGFYYVTDRSGETYQTRARGVFRKKKVTPLVGDYVEFELDENNEGIIKNISERKNELSRPAVSNIDMGVIITSVVEPYFTPQLLDRFLVHLEYNRIRSVIYFTKTDLLDDKELKEIQDFRAYYKSIGYTCIIPNDATIHSDPLKEIFNDKTVVFMGQSGAGKSTLLNRLDDTLNLKTAETSKALGRGKHTTRHVELLPLFDGLVADTPGFSSIAFDTIEKEELSECFPEIWARRAKCKFSGCLHYKEPKCAVKKAVKDDEIPQFRYDDYVLFLEEIMNRKPDYRKNK